MSDLDIMAGRRERNLVRLDDVTIDLVAEGRGPLIVLLPSRGRDSEDFDEVAAGLARAGFRVLRPQPRGACRSSGPLEGIRLQDLARDVARVIELEQAGPAVVAGHAFGSWVARMIAVDHPQLVRGIGLLAAAAKVIPPELRLAVQQAGDITLPEATRLAALARGFFLPGHDPRPWLSGWWEGAIRAQVCAVAATAQAEYWHAGTVPLLDLVSEHDPFKPRERWRESTEDFGNRVTFRLVPQASHALIPEQPAAVVEAVAAWAGEL
jgi:pimeloyl-ACP methyl ester carboxylesterase